MFDIQYYSDLLLNLGRTRTGKTLYRIAVGVVGVLILAGFFLALMTPRGVAALFPLIVGFNTALTGYGLIDSTRSSYKHMRLAAVLAGVVVVLIATLMVNWLFWQMAGPGEGGVNPNGWGLIAMDRLWGLLVVGAVTSWLGGSLAVKYFKLNQSAGAERRP